MGQGTEQKQQFSVSDVIESAFTLRNGTAVKQIYYAMNESIRQQQPMKYPCPQPVTVSKSMLRHSTQSIANNFLIKIKAKENEMDSSEDNDSDNEEMDDSDAESDQGLDGFF